MQPPVKFMSVAMVVFAAVALPSGPAALAKKSGSEVRSESPPSGLGSSVDDRQAKSGSSGGYSGSSGGNSDSSGGSGGDDGSGSNRSSRSGDNSGSGSSARFGSRQPIVIMGDDRLLTAAVAGA